MPTPYLELIEKWFRQMGTQLFEKKVYLCSMNLVDSCALKKEPSG